jgi:hypothetical protein
VFSPTRIPTSLETLTTIRNLEIFDMARRLYRALYALATTAGYLMRHGTGRGPFSGDR